MKLLLTAFITILTLTSCAGSDLKKMADTTQSDQLEVLYFHGKKRCVTCNAIESLTREVVDSLCNDKIAIRVIDTSRPENQTIVDKYEVAWSSLIVEYGGEVVNMTNIGFSYAKNRPAEFKATLVEQINSMLK